MGLIETAKAALAGNRAYRAHVEGNKLAGQGKPAEAREKFMAAMKLYDESDRCGNTAPNIMQAHALLLLREGEFDRARDVMTRMSKQKTLSKEDWFQLRLQYAILQWRTGEIDKAIETMGRAAAYKMNGTVYGTLGMFWVDKARQTGDFEAALKFNQDAMEYDDEDAATLDNMAQLYEAQAEATDDAQAAAGLRDQAREMYRRALKVKPRQITSIYYLARMYHRDGDDARARELLSERDKMYFSHICPVSKEMMDELAAEVGK